MGEAGNWHRRPFERGLCERMVKDIAGVSCSRGCALNCMIQYNYYTACRHLRRHTAPVAKIVINAVKVVLNLCDGAVLAVPGCAQRVVAGAFSRSLLPAVE